MQDEWHTRHDNQHAKTLTFGVEFENSDSNQEHLKSWHAGLGNLVCPAFYLLAMAIQV